MLRKICFLTIPRTIAPEENCASLKKKKKNRLLGEKNSVNNLPHAISPELQMGEMWNKVCLMTSSFRHCFILA